MHRRFQTRIAAGSDGERAVAPTAWEGVDVRVMPDGALPVSDDVPTSSIVSAARIHTDSARGPARECDRAPAPRSRKPMRPAIRGSARILLMVRQKAAPNARAATV
jgi:hypothetical protein